MTRLFVILLIWAMASSAFAQSASLLMGARAAGLGYASACLSDQWSVLNNVAGIAEVKKLSFGFSHSAHPFMQPFNRIAAVVAIPVASSGLAFSAFRFGDDLYSEQVFSTAFANTFGLASLGLKLNYIQYHAEGFGTRAVVTASFGGIATLTPKLMIGAHITNINQPRIASANGEERVPTRLAAALAFKPSAKAIVTAEAERDLDRGVTWKGGVEYQFHQKFFFRTGFNVNPDAAFLGTGFCPRRTSIDYAFQYHLATGVNHHVTLSYKFLKK